MDMFFTRKALQEAVSRLTQDCFDSTDFQEAQVSTIRGSQQSREPFKEMQNRRSGIRSPPTVCFNLIAIQQPFVSEAYLSAKITATQPFETKAGQPSSQARNSGSNQTLCRIVQFSTTMANEFEHAANCQERDGHQLRKGEFFYSLADFNVVFQAILRGPDQVFICEAINFKERSQCTYVGRLVNACTQYQEVCFRFRVNDLSISVTHLQAGRDLHVAGFHYIPERYSRIATKAH